jgi:hypothetical protein
MLAAVDSRGPRIAVERREAQRARSRRSPQGDVCGARRARQRERMATSVRVARPTLWRLPALHFRAWLGVLGVAWRDDETVTLDDNSDAIALRERERLRSPSLQTRTIADEQSQSPRSPRPAKRGEGADPRLDRGEAGEGRLPKGALSRLALLRSPPSPASGRGEMGALPCTCDSPLQGEVSCKAVIRVLGATLYSVGKAKEFRE